MKNGLLVFWFLIYGGIGKNHLLKYSLYGRGYSIESKRPEDHFALIINELTGSLRDNSL